MPARCCDAQDEAGRRNAACAQWHAGSCRSWLPSIAWRLTSACSCAGGLQPRGKRATAHTVLSKQIVVTVGADFRGTAWHRRPKQSMLLAHKNHLGMSGVFVALRTKQMHRGGMHVVTT